ncbi:hypothetical protein BDZ89DRAFT_1246872 [Hymenopellis radicata]|nr:hypothetical protein BDZ89DRAFT_1246872 [Hymenopellis radicata]
MLWTVSRRRKPVIFTTILACDMSFCHVDIRSPSSYHQLQRRDDKYTLTASSTTMKTVAWSCDHRSMTATTPASDNDCLEPRRPPRSMSTTTPRQRLPGFDHPLDKCVLDLACYYRPLSPADLLGQRVATNNVYGHDKMATTYHPRLPPNDNSPVNARLDDESRYGYFRSKTTTPTLTIMKDDDESLPTSPRGRPFMPNDGSRLNDNCSCACLMTLPERRCRRQLSLRYNFTTMMTTSHEDNSSA